MMSNLEVDAMFDADIPEGYERCTAPGFWLGAMRSNHAETVPTTHRSPILWCATCHGIGYVKRVAA